MWLKWTCPIDRTRNVLSLCPSLKYRTKKDYFLFISYGNLLSWVFTISHVHLFVLYFYHIWLVNIYFDWQVASGQLARIDKSIRKLWVKELTCNHVPQLTDKLSLSEEPRVLQQLPVDHPRPRPCTPWSASAGCCSLDGMHARRLRNRRNSLSMSATSWETCFCHMRTTKAQTSLRIHTVWSAPLLFTA